MPTVYSLYRARKQRDSVVFKCINISDINIEKIFVYVSSTTVQTRVQCNDLTRIYLYQSLSKLLYKHCYNCETIEIKSDIIEYMRKAENDS
jgi:hypothetical protein